LRIALEVLKFLRTLATVKHAETARPSPRVQRTRPGE